MSINRCFFSSRLRLAFAQESHQRISLVLVDRPVELTPSSRLLVCVTCPRSGTATPTPRETAESQSDNSLYFVEAQAGRRAMILTQSGQMSVRHHSHHAKSVWSSSHNEHSVSPLSGRTHCGPKHPSHLYGSASSSPECSSPG